MDQKETKIQIQIHTCKSMDAILELAACIYFIWMFGQ